MKRRLVGLLTVFLFLFSVPLIAGAVDQSANDQKEAAQNENPYVQKYLEERGTVADESSLFNSSEQRASDMETLVEIYREDTKVGGILQKYSMSTFSGTSVDYAEKATSLDREQIIQVMHNIERVYPAASEDEQELMLSYLLHHARACEDPQAIAFLESLNNVDRALPLYKYNGSNAAAYARAHARSGTYNTSQYPDMSGLGGDCTNFVSQCMFAGGITMRETWYIKKINGTYTRPVNADQLNYSWQLADPSPWTTIRMYTAYWFPKVEVKQYSKDNYNSNYRTIYSSSGVSAGDIVIFTSGLFGVTTWGAHAMIVTGFDTVNKHILVSGHTNDRLNAKLYDLTALSNYAGIDFYKF